MTTTKYLQLPIPSKSDRGKIITECLDPAFTKMDQKIESIDSNIDFNLLATLGIPYGGILNNTNAKVAGTAYYDTANKKIYKCTANTSINYADSAYFEEISNNDLLGKLKNLVSCRNEPSGFLTTKCGDKEITIQWLNVQMQSHNESRIFQLVKPFKKLGFQAFACYDYPSSENAFVAAAKIVNLTEVMVSCFRVNGASTTPIMRVFCIGE